MIFTKDGVSIDYIQPELLFGLWVADRVWGSRFHRPPFVITSISDGEHRVGSRHYAGQAADIRSHDLTTDGKTEVLADLRAALEPLGFDVLLEDIGLPNEHFHIEYDPTPRTVET